MRQSSSRGQRGSSRRRRRLTPSWLPSKKAGDRRVILFNFSGHGLLDLGAYDQYFAGKLEDYAYPAEKVKEALAALPKV
jgi:tryptophan synthase beta chain